MGEFPPSPVVDDPAIEQGEFCFVRSLKPPHRLFENVDRDLCGPVGKVGVAQFEPSPEFGDPNVEVVHFGYGIRGCGDAADLVAFCSFPRAIFQNDALPMGEQFSPQAVEPHLQTIADSVEGVDAEIRHPFIGAESDSTRLSCQSARQGRLSGSGQTAEKRKNRPPRNVFFDFHDFVTTVSRHLVTREEAQAHPATGSAPRDAAPTWRPHDQRDCVGKA